MNTVIIILTVLVSILLIAVVLVQKSKGGGLASNFSGSNQIMGVRRTNDVIEKATWFLAAFIGLLSIVSVFVAPTITTGASRVAPVAPAATAPVDYNTPATPAADAVPAVVEVPAADEAAAE